MRAKTFALAHTSTPSSYAKVVGDPGRFASDAARCRGFGWRRPGRPTARSGALHRAGCEDSWADRRQDPKAATEPCGLPIAGAAGDHPPSSASGVRLG
jgi:hypothetical protein